MNRPQHLSDDELIGMLYGIGDKEDADSHLADCSECSERWSAMHRALGMVRSESAKTAEISARRLAVQRMQILERLEHPSSGLLAWRWVPVATAASLLAAAMIFHHQRPGVPHAAPPAAMAVNAEADSELFTDVYSMEQDVEPRAAAPIRALFQEASFEEGH
ncbi:MAG: hypothetical protein ACRD4E_12025 [Bryobacteraceae bacterium]